MKGVEIMFGRIKINTANLTGVFAMVIAALFLVSLATQVNAEESKANIRGEVVAVDHNAGTVTLRSLDKDTFTFSMDKGTNVTSCTQNMIFRDIGVGEKVTVTYHEAANRFVADVIDIEPVAIAYACIDE